jgi:hypothetical protein
VRTPVGRRGGALAGVRSDDLAATVIAEAVRRAGAPPEQIEDVYFGAANQAGEDNRNVARMGVLLAGLPQSVAGVTVKSPVRLGLVCGGVCVPRDRRRGRRAVRRRRRRVDEPCAARACAARLR